MRITRAARAAVTFLPPSCHIAGWWWPYPPLARYLRKLSIWSARTHYHTIHYSFKDNWLKEAAPWYRTKPYALQLLLLGCGIVTVNQSRSVHNKSKLTKTSWKELTKWCNKMADREFHRSYYVFWRQTYMGVLKDNRLAHDPTTSAQHLCWL